jgi:hypothetical protein
MFLGLAVVFWIYEWRKYGVYMMSEGACVGAGVIINSALKLWIISEAGHRLGEDRRSGAFELLLATPLTTGDILRGQWLALRRQFLKPLLVVTALELVLILANFFEAADALTCLAGVVMLWADGAALAWVAMAAAMICKSQTQAAAFTVARILILPWVAFACIMAGIGLLYLSDLTHWQPSDQFASGLWFGLGLAADLLFGLRALHVVKKKFRRLAMQSFLPEPPRSPWWNFWRKAANGMGRLATRCVPARARKPVFACLAAGVALAAVFLARPRQPHFPPPVLVSITQSNAPFRVFPGGSSGVFFIMPDGTLWQWGKPGAPQSPRSVVPEQIGHADDWVKVVGAGTHCLGLRTNGTIWGWGFSNGRIWPEPRPAIAGHDWVDLATGQHLASAVKRDGSLWTWNEPIVANDGHAFPRRMGEFTFSQSAGPPRNIGNLTNKVYKFSQSPRQGPKSRLNGWVAVYCGTESTIALQTDGTLWAWGNFSGSRAMPGISSRFPIPILFCAETNWTALDADGMARNQLGQLWDVADAVPNEQAGAWSVCSLASSNWESDRVCSVPSWERAQIRADGTLWLARLDPSSFLQAPLAGDWTRSGARSDWVAVWGAGETGFGMTADGMLWTWGLELGKEPVKTYESRLELLRDRLTGRAAPTASRLTSSYSAQPRPLLKLVEGKGKQQRK